MAFKLYYPLPYDPQNPRPTKRNFVAQGTYHKKDTIVAFLIDANHKDDHCKIVWGKPHPLPDMGEQNSFPWAWRFEGVADGMYHFVAMDPTGPTNDSRLFEVRNGAEHGVNIIFPRNGDDVGRSFTAQVRRTTTEVVTDGDMICANSDHNTDETNIMGPMGMDYFLNFNVLDMTLHNDYTLRVWWTGGSGNPPATENGITVIGN